MEVAPPADSISRISPVVFPLENESVLFILLFLLSLRAKTVTQKIVRLRREKIDHNIATV